MIIFLTIIWLGLIALLVGIKVLPNKPASWLSTVVVFIALNIFLLIPLQWSAPTGDAAVIVNTVPIVPNVAGQVTEVVAERNVPVKAGDELFRIDPVPYQARLDALDAQLELARLRVEQFKELGQGPAGRRFDLEEAQTAMRQLEAQHTAAAYDLEQTTVVAPADGFVTTLALRPGQRVTTAPIAPVMTFIETEGIVVAAQIAQNAIRFVEPGQPVELAFKTRPGQIFTGTVDSVVEVNAQGQVMTSGTVIATRNLQSVPYFVRIQMDDPNILKALRGGAAGTAVIFTPKLQVAHIIRRVMLRMESYLNFVVP
ncbi:efflux transporter periplasmic adaptor subunit [Acuticoccus sediminis]|uniref:Efflux transporter periplasmic adaptor subunit n=1 Tax=Acuticoccus sediminis TaxID=2184697 RepID=A0A8B2NRD3_9HYPH|nr:efflux RND transporter periplasmic adaptor subunit [Acuticoccus sediminis]RAH99902.1 efflux transporter periplasmic adaptor subunit [Acuticoccus sediminis]